MDIVTIDGLPVFQALVSDDGTGMFRISLVDQPAVMSDFMAFKNQAPAAQQKARQLYAVQDEDKHLVLGVVMRADFPIYRRSDDLGEYYVIYKADTLRIMAEKYLAENRQNLVNLMHEEGSDVDGVQMVQYFIKDTALGVVPAGFDDIADGSLFAEFHVTNEDVWAAIKDGTYRGFSLEGVFDLVPETDKDFVQNVVDILDGAFSRLFKNQPNKYNAMKKKGLLTRLAAALVQMEMGNTTTDKGILVWDGDDDLKAGDAVQIEDADGNRTTAPDDTYTTEDGKRIVVVDGKVSEILDPAAQVEPGEGEEFGSVATDNGTLQWEGDEDLKSGDNVFITDADGNTEPAPDGDYKTEDGKTITVVDGKVASITDAAAQVAPVEARKQRFARVKALFEESYEDKMRKIYEAIVALGFDPYGYLVESGDNYAIYEIWKEDGEHYTRFDVSWDADGKAVVSNPVEVRPAFVEKDAAPVEPTASVEEVESLRQENATLKAQVAAMKKTPAAKPAHESFVESGAAESTGNKKLDNLSRIARATAK